jgi:hypothetical protein
MRWQCEYKPAAFTAHAVQQGRQPHIRVWVRSGAGMCQTCLRAGEAWCKKLTVYCMLVTILVHTHAWAPPSCANHIQQAVAW